MSHHEPAFVLPSGVASSFELSTHLPFRVAVVSNLLALNRDQNIRSIADLALTELRVLILIGAYMPIKANEIAYQARIESAQVNQAISVLLNKSYIEHCNQATPSHQPQLTLTDMGSDLYFKLVDTLDSRARAIESVLSEEEKLSFYTCLAKVEAKTEELLAKQALSFVNEGIELPKDQKEMLTWYKKRQEE